MSIRKNRNMIDINSAEAQIAADILEKGSSFLQALFIVNEYYINQGMDKISESQMHSAVNRLMPLHAKLLKAKQGSTNPDSDWTKERLNFCM